MPGAPAPSSVCGEFSSLIQATHPVGTVADAGELLLRYYY